MIIRDHLPFRRVWPQVSRRLCALFLFDLAVSVLYARGGAEFLALPGLPLGWIGSALSVLLAFRINSAYDRWWEARTLWGGLVNASRTFARQVLTLADPLGTVPACPVQRRLIHAQIGYVCALRCHLRQQSPFPELTGILGPAQADKLRGQKNVPAALLLDMGKQVRELFNTHRLDSIRLTALDSTLTELTTIQGGCERIKNTPLPRQYDYLPRLFVGIFCVLLPFGLVDGLRLLTPVASTLISFLFVALDTVGREIENPFENTVHDTPMSSLSRTIEINLRQYLGEAELPPEVQPVDGFAY